MADGVWITNPVFRFCAALLAVFGMLSFIVWLLFRGLFWPVATFELPGAPPSTSADAKAVVEPLLPKLGIDDLDANPDNWKTQKWDDSRWAVFMDDTTGETLGWKAIVEGADDGTIRVDILRTQ